MEQIKNILVLSTQDPYRSSGVGAYDIYKNLNNVKDFKVQLLVEKYGHNYEKGIVSIKNAYEYFFEKYKRKILKRILKTKSLNSNPDYHFHPIGKEYSTQKILKRMRMKPDVIIVFFAQNFISYKNLKELQSLSGAPIIWQFADMRPFTGGCHYAWDCNGYKRYCESCPAIDSDEVKDFPHFEIKSNYEYNKNLNITAVIGSDWLINRAKKSTLFKEKNIEKIFLPVDSSFFKPVEDNTVLKRKYKLSTNKRVILIAANYLDHKRKGIIKIFEALDILKKRYKSINNKVELFIVGHDLEKIMDKFPKDYTYIYSNYIERENLPDIYNVADIFISASLQDVGPYTIAESLLCGTPVVSFNIGYANDFVNRNTGVLVNNITATGLANGIETIFNYGEEKFNELKENGRKIVIEKASNKNQIESYKKLIKKLLNEK